VVIAISNCEPVSAGDEYTIAVIDAKRGNAQFLLRMSDKNRLRIIEIRSLHLIDPKCYLPSVPE